MTLAHFIYIPGMLGLGMVIGFVLGGRAAQGAKVEADEKAARRKAREARRAARDRGQAE
jgi:hypothetical protein